MSPLQKPPQPGSRQKRKQLRAHGRSSMQTTQGQWSGWEGSPGGMKVPRHLEMRRKGSVSHFLASSPFESPLSLEQCWREMHNVVDATDSPPIAPVPSPEDPCRHSCTQHWPFGTLYLAQEHAEPTHGAGAGAREFTLQELLSISEGGSWWVNTPASSLLSGTLLRCVLDWTPVAHSGQLLTICMSFPPLPDPLPYPHLLVLPGIPLK